MGSRSNFPTPGLISWLAAASAVALLALSCSSAPKPPDAVFDVKNKAADYSKLADGFMADAQYESAEKYYREALQADSSVDNLAGVSVAHASLGRVYLAVNRPDDARTEFTIALEYATMAHSGPDASLATSGLGEVMYAHGEKEEALAAFESAAALAGKDAKSLAVALHDAGVAKAALGRTEEAMSDLQRASSLNQELKRWTELASNRYVMASILGTSGRLQEALAMALKALEADKNAENGRGVAQDLEALARLSYKLGQKETAWNYWRRAFDSSLSVEEPSVVRDSLVALAALADELGKPDEKARYSALLAKLDAAQAASQAGK